jgi:hypothetical protein
MTLTRYPPIWTLLRRVAFVSGAVQIWATCAVRITWVSGHLLLAGDFLGAGREVPRCWRSTTIWPSTGTLVQRPGEEETGPKPPKEP